MTVAQPLSPGAVAPASPPLVLPPCLGPLQSSALSGGTRAFCLLSLRLPGAGLTSGQWWEYGPCVYFCPKSFVCGDGTRLVFSGDWTWAKPRWEPSLCPGSHLLASCGQTPSPVEGAVMASGSPSPLLVQTLGLWRGQGEGKAERGHSGAGDGGLPSKFGVLWGGCLLQHKNKPEWTWFPLAE